MACSNGAATVSEIVFGLAPGYEACTTIVGGTTSGYSLMGRRHIAINPTIRIKADSTPAKIGRRMKKLEKFIMIPWKSPVVDYRCAVRRPCSFAATAVSAETG